MNRLPIDIRPYPSFRGNPWRRLDTPKWYARRSKALAAVAIVVAIMVALLSGCGACADVDRSDPRGLAEWDKYGCSRD